MTFQNEVRSSVPGGRRAWWRGGLPVLAQRAPAPASVKLPPEVLSLACAPKLAFEAPPTPLRVTGSQESFVHRSLRPRRPDHDQRGHRQRHRGRPGVLHAPRRARSSGARSAATIRPRSGRRAGSASRRWTTRCRSPRSRTRATGIELNDYLEPFVLPDEPAISAIRPKAQRGNYGRVMTGNDSRTSFGRGDYFVVDRGSDHGVSRGAQLRRLPRQPAAGEFPVRAWRGGGGGSRCPSRRRCGSRCRATRSWRATTSRLRK